MAELIYATRALADLDRLTDFLRESAPAAALATVNLIVEAIQVLANHPLIGRVVDGEIRELVISRGHSGYVALYSFEEDSDVVLVLAVRHQREAGY
ncbi:type II toxin-antitoxin system RelE/ParE family toxin [Solimonas sp. K1W22B-7]|uniref:type II toxin-antitoxin system RelE/ParE family toxin n=1 Tax=Solimonas sp. K1W22B-7 TaxID=2303331 RepID=UPI000E3368CC|nr:type II toxin-antitoxin system RelE/ParE family toxin [Solimonas sp. K1W22B-7]AXQ30392.1 type II toxin-antitoxin system RelE/ParE family toxin [Solimonas sp. K1W22B-7]